MTVSADGSRGETSSGIVWDRTSVDLGTVRLGDVRSVGLGLTVAAETAVIVSATTNCQCTQAAYPRKPLRRGDREAVEIRYEAREEGYFRKTVTVRYIADGESRSEVLSVSGHVDPDRKKN
ncbi:MAG: DUF1573 domain-containing protein [Alistipes communis]|nr:DUF1573 domain-containing protein [Alistipes communis]